MLWRAVVAAALAATAPSSAAAADDGFSLSVSPARTISTPVAGRASETFKVNNSGRDHLQVRVAVGTFDQQRNGGVVFAPGDTASAASWVTVSPASFDLPAGATQSVGVTVQMPDRPEPGEHQVGITFVVPAKRGEGEVVLNRGIGTQLLVRVPGDIVRRVEISDVDLPWLADGRVRLRAVVRNHGNVHETLAGPRSVVAEAGRGQAARFPSFTVLRDTDRLVETQWLHPPLLCLCRVRISAPDGQGGRTVASARVLVLPLRLIAAVLLVVAGAGLVVRARHRRAT